MKLPEFISSSITTCRLCDSPKFEVILDLGEQPLSGIFPLVSEQDPPVGKLVLVKCLMCELVQLGHNFPKEWLYGDNYGYRSGLNKSMVIHLEAKSNRLFEKYVSNKEQIFLDIGSNDGTLLNGIVGECEKVGIDPTSEKFKQFYDESISVIPKFFSAENYLSEFPKAQVISSISMFYDLESPRQFVSDIKKSLDKRGVWHFEQSYLSSMLEANAYDTICHEHLEYYSLRTVNYLLQSEGLKIIDVELNRINGGSFAVTATHVENDIEPSPIVKWQLDVEEIKERQSRNPLERFKEFVPLHRSWLRSLVHDLKGKGKTIWGVGASTKGNVLLNYCDLSSKEIQWICDVNEYKYGRVTPGSRIRICNEKELVNEMPDFALVLPWHFRENISSKLSSYTSKGGRLIFPLPQIEVVS